MDDLGLESRQWLGIFLFITGVQTDTGAHPASYPMGTRDSFAWGKAAGTLPLTSV
jgi:hypothetical protein